MIFSRSQEVLKFWFDKKHASLLFKKNNDFDQLIKDSFENLIEHYSQQKIFFQNIEDALAFIIVLDQFPRNIYRNQPRSFAYDKIALEATFFLLDRFPYKNMHFSQFHFAIMPLMHSEQLQHQAKCIYLIKNELKHHPDQKSILKFAERHYEIIEMFGRFPHRNEILGRKSTNQELNFLEQPFSSF